jgi:hypothetical protein
MISSGMGFALLQPVLQSTSSPASDGIASPNGQFPKMVIDEEYKMLPS